MGNTVNGTLGDEKESYVSRRRFSKPFTNVPNIPMFTFRPPRAMQESEVSLSPTDGNKGLSEYGQEQMSFDFAIFHADSRESEDEVINFIEFVERFCHFLPKNPKIWAAVSDIDGVDRDYLEAVEYGLKNSNYYFLYIDKCFAHDKWANFQQMQCLHQYFQETKVIVPVETIKNYSMPFALRVFSPLKPWRLINNIDNLSFRAFLDYPVVYKNAWDQNYLEIMKTIFTKICAGDLRPLFLLE